MKEKNINDITVIICSIVRDASKGLMKNIPVIDSFLSKVKYYRIVVFENDSIDNTKHILKEWQSRTGSDKFFLKMENNHSTPTIPTKKEVNAVNPFYSSKRIDKMVTLRNQYVDFLSNLECDFDYIIVVDLDVAQIDLEGLVDSFNLNTEWDAICANGYSLSPRLKKRYHDTYALTLWGDEEAPQTEDKIIKLATKFGRLKSSDSLIRVFSAFGGLAIYRYEAIKGIKYQLLKNIDPRVEVRCEHYSIYKQMIQNGYDKIYINPAMLVKYQSISIQFVLKWIKRKLAE